MSAKPTVPSEAAGHRRLSGHDIELVDRPGHRHTSSTDTEHADSGWHQERQEKTRSWDSAYAASAMRLRATFSGDTLKSRAQSLRTESGLSQKRYSRKWARSACDFLKNPARSIKHAWKLRKMLPPTKDGRHIPVSLKHTAPLLDERTRRPYKSNVISSAIYSAVDFLPRQLLYQFSKLANVYFLAVSILQMIPSWSTTGSYTTIVPLMVFVSISIAREGYDDYRRHRHDKVENMRKTLVAVIDEETGKVDYQNTEWRKIKVGDIVRVQQNEWFPADVVLLHSSGINGQTYIETMALDGETNLKIKDTPLPLQETFTVDNMPVITDAVCTVEDPNLDLYNFEGSFHINGKRIPLGNDNIVYRGSILRNTASCFGLVVFTGEETKIRQNATENARSKAPKLQAKVNYIVILMAIFVLLLSGFSTLASNRLQASKGDKYWYLQGLHVGVVPNLFGFIIMFNTLIPLSLYVSLEICKVFQLMVMQNDIDMYDAGTDTPCSCQTASLNEELGQVSYVFSDKTGTLTENIMLFRKMSVAGYAWVHDLDLLIEYEELCAEEERTASIQSTTVGSDARSSDDHAVTNKSYLFHKANPRRGPSVDIFNHVAALPRASLAAPGLTSARTSRLGKRSGFHPERQSADPHSRVSGRSAAPHWTSSAAPQKPQIEASTLSLLEYILAHPKSLFSQKAKLFLLSMALCHSATPEVDLAQVADGSLEIEYLSYQAASPDELALVSAARDMGYLVIDKEFGSITIRTYPNGFDEAPLDDVYQILGTIEFTSGRKRMSVIVRFPDGRTCLMSKGADNVMIERLRSSILDAAKHKVSELHKQANLRRNVEAEMVLARQSTANDSMNRLRNSISHNPDMAMFSLEEHLRRASQENEVVEAGRRSMEAHLKRSLDFQASTRNPKSKHGTISDHAIPDRGTTSLDWSAKLRSKHERRASFETAPEEQPNDRLVIDERFVLERTLEHIDEFSTEGLRTLMYGHRFLSNAEFDSWNRRYEEARTSLVDRQKKIDQVAEDLEKDYEITGATAIEDKLQKGVPEAIEKLRSANIRMWMLTGDKRETAINIGYSCRLIKDFSTVIVLSKEEDLSTKIMAALDELEERDIAHCVVVIDGHTLATIEEDSALLSLFVDLGLRADSVIVCRASPAQKASMVRQVRKKQPNKVMLAIGDGANDIAMIQSADVGVGIAGKEGLQAARSSDYSIGQFRFLLKLLLVQGRWNYVRTCKYILSTFYKEFFFYMAQMVFQRNTMFTGTSLYESWSISMFNTLFTSLPVICMGIIEQDLCPSTLIAVPELYSIGQTNSAFNIPKFIWWITLAMAQCLCVSFLAVQFWGYDFGVSDNTLYPLGVVVYTCVVIVICVKILFLEMFYVSIFNVLAAVISICGYLLWNLLIGALALKNPEPIYFVHDGFKDRFGKDLDYWTCVLLISAICCTFEFLLKMRSQIRPNDTEVFQVLEKDPFIRTRLDEESKLELSQGWEYQAKLPKGWNAIFHLKWPGQPLPKLVSTAVTSRRRRRDVWAQKLWLGRRFSTYDNEIQDILERREQELGMNRV